MSTRTIIFLALALIAAIGTVFVARSWLDSQKVPVEAKAVAAATQDVGPLILVAKDDLPAGLLIKAEDLRWQAWPDEGLAPSYVLQGTAEIEDFAGSVVRKGIASGEPITIGRVVKPGEQGFLAAMLTPGMRAVSVPINATSGIAGLIFPGDRVDLILTHAISRNEGQEKLTRRASETVLKDIRVLAVDQRTDDPEGQPGLAKTATLEVTPKQAEKIAVVTDIGRVSLSLRSLAVQAIQANGESDQVTETDQANETDKALKRVRSSQIRLPSYTLDNEVSSLLSTPKALKRKQQRTVQVVRGSESQVLTFNKSDDATVGATSSPTIPVKETVR